MNLLLDTNIVIRWRAEPSKLSKDQYQVLERAVRDREALGISAITLMEIALLFTHGPLRIRTTTAANLFDDLRTNPMFQILPLTIEVAEEVLKIGSALRDPADRVIAATARVHGLRLLTSDQRIVASNLVSTID